MSNILLKMKNITKEFPGVKALENVNFEVEEGEIHALVGENGAGKSTLMKVLSGVHPYGSYSGDIEYDNENVKFENVNDSESEGIVIIHQELALIPELTVAENIFLGNEQLKNRFIDWNLTTQRAKKLIDRVGLKANSSDHINQIGVGQQQLVEIAKALSKDVKLLILDEPTAALNEKESENLLGLLKEFKAQGITSIIITHKLKEVIAVADNVTVLRDGQTVETLKNEGLTQPRIIKSMVGRELKDLYPSRNADIGDVKFEIKDWTIAHPTVSNKNLIDKASLNVRSGEVVGVAGLMGAGRTELMMSVFGRSLGKYTGGTLYKDGQEIKATNVSDAISHGIAYVSEDRKEYGLLLEDSVKNNISLANLNKLKKGYTIDRHAETNVANNYIDKLNIKTPSMEQKLNNLSGGNQQKVVLGKWMFTDPEILILDEPTRGIDVGAKNEIYKLINQQAEEGKSIIIISSELPELLGLCDRIYTLSSGKITAEVPIEEAEEEKLMTYMTSDGGF